MIISVGYRVRSQRGIIFKRWANRILKDYLGNIPSENFAGGIIGENEDDAINTADSNNVGQISGANGHTGNLVCYDGKQRKSY